MVALEFTEISELLPEACHADQGQAKSCCRQGRRQTRQTPVTNILVWLECYRLLAAVLGAAYPAYIGDLVAYQQTIIGACRNYEEVAWVIYDRVYCCWATAQRALNWAWVDTGFYQQTFTRRAVRI